MSARTAVLALATGFLLASVQLVVTLLDPRLAIACGVAIGLLVFGLCRLFNIEFEHRWAPIPLAVLSSASGLVVVMVGRAESMGRLIWYAPAAALLVTVVVVLLQRTVPRCALCNRPLRGGLSFECPRCGLRVCEWGCWEFEYSRCRLCMQSRVPIFTPDARWWEQQLGVRVDSGRCKLCLAQAEETDLRSCPTCGRPQCRDCWDYTNGTCSHCDWRIPDLPPLLASYVSDRGVAADGER